MESDEGSPEQIVREKGIPGNEDSSADSVVSEKTLFLDDEISKTSASETVQENIHHKTIITHDDLSSLDEGEILQAQVFKKELDVATSSADTVKKGSSSEDESQTLIAVEHGVRRGGGIDRYNIATVKLLEAEKRVIEESGANRDRDMLSLESSAKLDEKIVAAKTYIKSIQHKTTSNTSYNLEDLSGPIDALTENRQAVETVNCSEGLERLSGTVQGDAFDSSVLISELDTSSNHGAEKEVEKAANAEEELVGNKDDGGVLGLTDACTDMPQVDSQVTNVAVLENKDDNTTHGYGVINLQSFVTKTDDIPLLNSKHEQRSTSFCSIQGSLFGTLEEKCNKTNSLEESEYCQKIKKKYRKKPPSLSRATQTAIHLLDSSEFRDYSFDLAKMQVEIGFMSVDSLQDLDPSLDDWPVLLVSQLSLRDTMINTLNSKLLDLLSKGRTLEQDIDYLKLKIWDLKQQVKKNKQNRTEECSQTTEEDFAHAWKKWYCGSWNQYYGENDPSSVHYWPGHYAQQSTVSYTTHVKPTKDDENSIPERSVTNDKDEIQDSLEKNEKNFDNIIASLGSEDNQHTFTESHSQEQGADSKVDMAEHKQTVTKKKKRSNSEQLCKLQEDAKWCDKDSVKRVDGSDGEHKAETSTLAVSEIVTESLEISENSSISRSQEVDRLSSDTIIKLEHQTSGLKDENVLEEHTNVGEYYPWDKSGGMSVTEQVKAVAAEAVQGSGYVFQEELGLYFDYTSGYYYNAENGLYYDSKTGTYFYYDHASQAYQFHSQVPVKRQGKRRLEKNEGEEKEKEVHEEKKKKIPKVKAVDPADREEGECTDTDEEIEEGDALMVDSEEDEEVNTELDEEAGMSEDCNEVEEAAVHVPPSLRLMVVESESERIKVGTLHLITLNGGTVGRETRNLVQLSDISISKVHAEITYKSEGPDDHHYYIKDLGSNNGTFVNGVRLSEPREISQEVEIGHGWMLQFGAVKLKCHVHPGRLTCNDCEPGLVISSLPSHTQSDTGGSVATFKDAKSREKARKKQLKALRKKYAVTCKGELPTTDVQYTDRALRRLREVGSDNPYEKTEIASTDTALRENNKGYTLLQKMGWSEGQALGKSQIGITEPIQPESVVGHGGLGCTQVTVPLEPAVERRRKQLQITQHRYKQT